jgi:hypothetical protein
LLVGLPLWLGTAMPEQARERDAGTFTILANGAVVGREEFTIRDGRAADRGGFTVSWKRFTGDGVDPTFVATTELGPDSQPISSQLVEAAAQRRILIQASPRRVTVRAVTPAGESVREYRGGDPLWFADDSSATWFALPPRAGAQSVTVVWPKDDRREISALADRGIEATTLGAATQSLRHVVAGSGPGERHLWYDERGRLVKMDVPATGLQAIRATP